ncbi:MAG: hypothetical protein IKK82_13150 [Kiritimatiellae bacterium]|nr:hypothetical protein [Kiritimatiellia bacterium]
MLEKIKELLLGVWDFIKKVFFKLVSFICNIVAFFKDPTRLLKLKADQNRIAVSIKEKLSSGEYQVVNCLFDKSSNELVNPEEDSQIITAEEIDEETERQFNGKEMIVLK